MWGAVLVVAPLSCSKAAADEPIAGAPLFASTCARCHGVEGTGGPPLGDGQPAPRNLTDPAFHAARTDAQLAETIKAGKGGFMPPFREVYSDAQVEALVAHVRSLKRK